MKLFTHSQDSMVEPLKFGLVISNLSNGSTSATTNRNDIIIIVITIIFSLK